MDRHAILDAFNKFAGREVPMTEKEISFEGRNMGRLRDSVVSPADKNDPVIREMRETAEKLGVKLRVIWPGVVTTRDFRNDRVNAHLVKQTDGKWRVGNTFNIG